MDTTVAGAARRSVDYYHRSDRLRGSGDRNGAGSRQYDAPLAQATTPSLEALSAGNLASRVDREVVLELVESFIK